MELAGTSLVHLLIFLKKSHFYVFLERPDNGYANSWILSMEQCKNSQLSFYLLGDVSLHNP